MRALVLSGGGARGAFQVGVIKRLVELGRRWGVIAGVSVGAVNALQLAQYAPADQARGAADLEAFWYEIAGDATLYRGWTFGVVEALFGRGALHDTAPMEAFLRARVDVARLQVSGVKFRVGAVGLGSGQYRCVDEYVADPVRWVMASAAFPGAFGPVAIDGDRWVDGGIRHTTPIVDALAAGATELDVVLTDPASGEGAFWDTQQAGDVVQVGLRAASILANQVFLADLAALTPRPGVTWRIYAPYAPWPGEPLTFDPKAIRHMIDVGYGIP